MKDIRKKGGQAGKKEREIKFYLLLSRTSSNQNKPETVRVALILVSFLDGLKVGGLKGLLYFSSSVTRVSLHMV